MSPKEKAKELVDKFSTEYLLKSEESRREGWMINTETIETRFKINGKTIALMLIDDITKEFLIPEIDDTQETEAYSPVEVFIVTRFKYWMEVKQEIKKL